jgi:hypothetical protein
MLRVLDENAVFHLNLLRFEDNLLVIIVTEGAGETHHLFLFILFDWSSLSFMIYVSSSVRLTVSLEVS